MIDWRTDRMPLTQIQPMFIPAVSNPNTFICEVLCHRSSYRLYPVRDKRLKCLDNCSDIFRGHGAHSFTVPTKKSSEGYVYPF